MLHYMLNTRFVRESHGHAALNRCVNLGAAIHRILNSKEFQWLVPVRWPPRRNTLLKQLTRQFFGDEIVRLERLANHATNEPVSDEFEVACFTAYVDKP